MDSPAYLHFNITNMVTIWIIVAIGFVALGLGNKLLNKNQAAS